MKQGIELGDTVRTKLHVDWLYGGTYTVIRAYKITCWMQTDEEYPIMMGGETILHPILKNVRYSNLEKVK